jgi:hypothetical protein
MVTNFVVAAGDDGLLHFHDSDGHLLKTHPTGHRKGVRVVTLVCTGTQVYPVIVTGGDDGSLLRFDLTVWIDSRYVEERCVEEKGGCGGRGGRGEKRRERGREKAGGGERVCAWCIVYVSSCVLLHESCIVYSNMSRP